MDRPIQFQSVRSMVALSVILSGCGGSQEAAPRSPTVTDTPTVTPVQPDMTIPQPPSPSPTPLPTQSPSLTPSPQKPVKELTTGMMLPDDVPVESQKVEPSKPDSSKGMQLPDNLNP